MKPGENHPMTVRRIRGLEPNSRAYTVALRTRRRPCKYHWPTFCNAHHWCHVTYSHRRPRGSHTCRESLLPLEYPGRV